MSKKVADKTKYHWILYGTIQINAEKEGFSEIIHSTGRTSPVLKIPRNEPHGWKRLTAIYAENDIYTTSFRRTLLFFGSKVWINCPCVFYDKRKNTVTVTANLYANNRKVPGGYGVFYYRGKCVSPEPVEVHDGFASQTFEVIPTHDGEPAPDPDQFGVIHHGDKFMFQYFFSERYGLAYDRGYGTIFIKNIPLGHAELEVEVPQIIMNVGDKAKLIARVYHKNYGTFINYPDDIPVGFDGAIVKFYVDGTFVGQSKTPNKNTGGFYSIDYPPAGVTPVVGAHNITATFIPDADNNPFYVKTSGCGTLFVGEDTNKPLLTVNTPLCTYIGNRAKTLSFTSDRDMNGLLQAYMDLYLLHLHGGTAPDWNVPVTTRNFTIEFDTISNWGTEYYHWNYSGYHNFILKYSVDDGGDYPMEYYYYLDDFYIQIPVRIELEGELDTNTHNGIFVGNNLFYVDDEGEVQWYSPDLAYRDPSTTIGNIVRVRVVNIENEKLLVDGGLLKFTFATRTKENNMSETIRNGRE